jgi:predicted nucleic acid-binding protein
MSGILVDSNIILDVFTDDPDWANWSQDQLEELAMDFPLFINPIIYSEISIGFQKIEELELALEGCGLKLLQIPKEALFLAGKAFLKYRIRKGKKIVPLPDFFIGAHAAISEMVLLTRDHSRYQTYFPTIQLIFPGK